MGVSILQGDGRDVLPTLTRIVRLMCFLVTSILAALAAWRWDVVLGS